MSINKQLRLAAASEETQQESSDNKAGFDIIRAKMSGGISSESNPTVSAVITEEERVEEYRKALSGSSLVLFGEAAKAVKADRDFALAIRDELRQIGLAPVPGWMRIIDMFTAEITIGENSIKVGVLSLGGQNNLLFSERLADARQAAEDLDNEIKALGNGVTPSRELQAKHNAAYARLSLESSLEMFRSVILDWSGPLFRGNRPLGRYDVDNEGEYETALKVMASLPKKLLDMIQEAVKILNRVGIEDVVAQGN